MENIILLDIKTSFFELNDNYEIHELAAIAIKNSIKNETLHLSIIKDIEKAKFGYGFGYENLSYNENFKNQFKSFIAKYSYPLFTPNASLHKNLLQFYNWIDAKHIFYDSKKTMKYLEPDLSCYSMENIVTFLDLTSKQQNTAIKTVENLYKIIQKFNINKDLQLNPQTHNYKINKNDLINKIKKNFNNSNNILNNKNIVFTGEGPLTRKKLIYLAKKHGAKITSNTITKKTDFLIVGKKPGKKLIKANILGIKTIDMDYFFTLISDSRTYFNSKEILEDINKTQLIFFPLVN